MTLPLMDVLIMAKQPVAGQVKTRLCPPLTAEEAARVYEAMLLDVLDTTTRAPCAQPVLCLRNGAGRSWGGRVVVLPQRGTDLAESIAHGFDDCRKLHGRRRTLMVTSDIPQLSIQNLEEMISLTAKADAAWAPSPDGGFWALGLSAAVPTAALARLPMSTGSTGTALHTALIKEGLSVRVGPELPDVDTWHDLVAARSRCSPDSHFSRAAREVGEASR